MPVSLAVAIMQTTAFVTAVMAYFISDESLGVNESILILIGVFGCILLTSPDLFMSENPDLIQR